jgi:molybdate transport system substrate-binding protein
MNARSIVAVGVSLLLPTQLQAAEIKLIASAGLRAAYLELLPQFKTATGHKVAAIWSSSQVIQKRIADGEPADLVILASVLGRNLTDELADQGKLVAGSRIVFAQSGVGVAVRAGAPQPDNTTAQARQQSLLAGTYVVTMLQKLGIYEEIKPKVAAVKPSEPVGEVVARGDAEIGFHQVSELLPVKGIQFVGPLPAELQNVTVYSGGIHSETKEPAAATALVQFLTAPAAIPVLRKHGLEPG